MIYALMLAFQFLLFLVDMGRGEHMEESMVKLFFTSIVLRWQAFYQSLSEQNAWVVLRRAGMR